MAVLSDAQWEDLHRWIESHSPWERFPIETSKPLRPNEQLQVWLHQLIPTKKSSQPKAPADSDDDAAPKAPDSSSPETGQEVDQSVNPYVFYFSIVDKQDWKQAGKKNLEGDDKEWEWFLSWAFPQQTIC
ncbi:hypothetical protein PG990_011627 [Apiospora arundinis]